MPAHRTSDRKKVHQSEPHTPYSIKINSDPRSHLRQFNVPVMDGLMRQELIAAIWTEVKPIAFVNHFFPNKKEFNVVKAYTDIPTLSNALLWDPKMCTPPGKGSIAKKAEHVISLWLNKVASIWGTTLTENSTRVRLPRTWSWDASTRPLNGITKRKPDIILTDCFKTPGGAWMWKDVLAFIEVTSMADITPGIKNTMYAKAFMIFQSQQHRRFVIALAICRLSLYFNVFDRAGAIHSSRINMMDDPQLVLRIIGGLVFGEFADIGYDPTLTLTSEGTVKTARCKDVEYDITSTLFANNMIRGRATICWSAKRHDEEYVIKDNWPNTMRTKSEHQFLERAKERGVSGVPRLIGYEDLPVNQVVDSSVPSRILTPEDVKRHAGTKMEIEMRAHRRLVLQPQAVPLPHFSSRRELISVLADIVQIHKNLVDIASILHRDISINNIMICCRGVGDLVSKGLLIDFDYATFLNEVEELSHPGHRTGTLPFMAVKILYDRNIIHLPAHDLESLLYVLIWICTMYKGPNNDEKLVFQVDPPILTWCKDKDKELSSLADTKMGQCSTEAIFKERVLDHFSPYFEDLKKCCMDLRKVFFGAGDRQPDHGQMLAIFQATLDDLPEEASAAPSRRQAAILEERDEEAWPKLNGGETINEDGEEPEDEADEDMEAELGSDIDEEMEGTSGEDEDDSDSGSRGKLNVTGARQIYARITSPPRARSSSPLGAHTLRQNRQV